MDSPQGRQLLCMAVFGTVIAPPKLRRETAVVPEYHVTRAAAGGTLTAALDSHFTLDVDGYLGGAEALTIDGFREIKALQPSTAAHTRRSARPRCSFPVLLFVCTLAPHTYTLTPQRVLAVGGWQLRVAGTLGQGSYGRATVAGILLG